MSVAPAVARPSARAWRKRFRRARRVHHDKPLGETLTDLYMVLWVFAVYGTALVAAIRRHMHPLPGQKAGPNPELHWIGVAVLFATAGLAWSAARAVGPLLATSAEQAWGLSTPIDRRSWLTPRFTSLVLVTGLVATVMVVIGPLLGGSLAGLGWIALAGSAYGVTLAACTVVVQGEAPGSRWLRPIGGLLLAAGAAMASAVVVAHYTSTALPHLALPRASTLALVGLPLALLAVAAATRTLPHLRRSALAAGADVATAALSTTALLDPSLLSGVLEVRRWRGVGRVRSRGFPLGKHGRQWALLQAELRRQLRRPGALALWAALALGLYVVAVVEPSAVGPMRIILAYLAAGRLMGGLRALSRSAGLRRMLGGSEVEQRLAHVIVPAAGTILWWALTAGAGGVHLDAVALVMIAGVVAAAYRGATRPPMSYGGAVFETPFGLFPFELVMQIARGPDLLAAVFIVHMVAR